VVSIRFGALTKFIGFVQLSNVFFPIESKNNNRFLEKSIVKKINFKGIFPLFNTEEVQTLIFHIFCMLNNYFKSVLT